MQFCIMHDSEVPTFPQRGHSPLITKYASSLTMSSAAGAALPWSREECRDAPFGSLERGAARGLGSLEEEDLQDIQSFLSMTVHK